MKKGQELIDELLADPIEFERRGRAYELLLEYFSGLPLETLKPLLRSENALVQHAAAFVASELGKSARALVDDVVPLVYSGDRSLAYDALEVLALCACGTAADRFAHVLRAVESDDEVLRALAVRLISRVEPEQIDGGAAALAAEPLRGNSHADGLSVLRAGERASVESVEKLLESSAAVDRRYGAIAVRRLSKPSLVERAASSVDPEIRKLISD